MNRLFLILGTVFGFTGVAAGAFGGHALKSHLSPDLLSIFEVGVRYQMYHALALTALGLIKLRRPAEPRLHFDTAAGWLFGAGIVLFSGSLYALSLSGIRSFGAVTPVGGVAFLAGWACLFLEGASIKKRRRPLK